MGLELSGTAVHEARAWADGAGLSHEVKQATHFVEADFFTYEDAEGGFDVGYDYT